MVKGARSSGSALVALEDHQKVMTYSRTCIHKTLGNSIKIGTEWLISSVSIIKTID